VITRVACSVFLNLAERMNADESFTFGSVLECSANNVADSG
jgi:hypothetical protein